MPGFVHRMFGWDDRTRDTKCLKADKTNLWEKGCPHGWYSHSKSSGMTFRKWWGRSLPAHIGLELFLYIIVYYIINIIYRVGLDSNDCSSQPREDNCQEGSKEKFDRLVYYFNENVSPLGKHLTFFLGFFVSQIVRRWWDQYKLLPWPDTLAALMHGLVDYEVDGAVEFSQEISRYALLSYVLCLRRISKSLKKMFPDNETLVDSRLATRKELAVMEKGMKENELGFVWWIPLSWCMSMTKGSKETKVIPSDQKILIDGIAKFQRSLEGVDAHDQIILPPLYQQVVRFAVYVYFMLSLIGHQQIQTHPDIGIPIFLILQFIFFFGWLEVAEAIANPFGTDEDDFQIQELVARHIWALGKNLSFNSGPPDNDGSQNSVDTLPSKTETSTLNFDFSRINVHS